MNFSFRTSHFVLQQKRLHLAQDGDEGINESGQKQIGRAGLILPFAEKLDGLHHPDERDPTGILTPDLSSLPPSRPV